MLTDRTVTQLLDAFSSSDPTPGGGSASALAGALGAAVLAMVAGLPTPKGGTEARATLDEARRKLLDLRTALAELVDRDAAAYDLVVAAFKRPKATEEETAARRSAIQDALRIATEVPIETIGTCGEAMRHGATVAEYGNPSATSDIGVAVELLLAAIKGARFNVEANISKLIDPAIVDNLSEVVITVTREISRDVARIFQASGILELTKRAMSRGPMLPHANG